MERPTVEVYLSSEHAKKRTEFVDDCEWQLERSIIAPDGMAMYVRVISMVMIVSWFNVSIHYNTIIINGTTFTLEEGDYSIKQLCSTLCSLIPGVYFEYNCINKKVRMTSATPTSLDGSLCILLGITPATGTVLVSKHVCDLTGNNTINVDSGFSSAFANIDARPNPSSGLLTRIASSQGAGTILFENFSGRDGLLITEDVLTSVRIMLTDEDNRPLRATLDYDLSLQVQFVPSYNTRMADDLPNPLQM
jgi:hypothetical protein